MTDTALSTTSPGAAPLRQPARRARLETSLRLRWLAIAGQSAAVVFVTLGLDFEMAIVPVVLLILASVAFNLTLLAQAPPRLSDAEFLLLLVFDATQLVGLLYFTGGLSNPFSVLMLVPCTVAAATLPLRLTLRLCLYVVVLVTGLAFHHHPLPWSSLSDLQLPALYMAGIWVALLLSLVFTLTYVHRVAAENRLLNEALGATELVLQREQHLTRLDGLAAAAAHELGTPLATITLTAKELARGLPEGHQSEDAALIAEQAKRCREILAKLSTLDDTEMIGWMSLRQTLQEAAAPYRGLPREDGSGEIDIQFDLPESRAPRMRRNPGVLYGLGNLIENAADFASSRVILHATWTARTVSVEIRDDGPGFSADMLRRLGEPYTTTRSVTGPAANPDDPSYGGLGLGFFIAKTLLERSGARLRLRNRTEPGTTGAVVRLDWPASLFRRPEDMDDAGGVPPSG